MHSIGYVHCDIKLDNIVTNESLEDKIENVYLIDFGASQRFLTDGDLHISFEETQSFIGNIMFASPNVMNFIRKYLRLLIVIV
jgi:serine/threonine protein kinase